MNPNKSYGRRIWGSARTAAVYAILTTSAGGLSASGRSDDTNTASHRAPKIELKLSKDGNAASDDLQTCSAHTEYRIVKLNGFKGFPYAYQEMENRPAEDPDNGRQALRSSGNLRPGKIITTKSLTDLIVYYLSKNDKSATYEALAVAHDLNEIQSFRPSRTDGIAVINRAEARFYVAPAADGKQQVVRDFEKAFRRTGNAIRAIEEVTGLALQTRSESAREIEYINSLAVDRSHQGELTCRALPLSPQQSP